MAEQNDRPSGTGQPDNVALQNPPAESVKTRPTPGKTPPRKLPPYKVLLHNDDVNLFEYVIRAIQRITALSQLDAELRAIEAHETGVSLLLVTHKERAELYQDQFTSAGLIVTIEPDEAV